LFVFLIIVLFTGIRWNVCLFFIWNSFILKHLNISSCLMSPLYFISWELSVQFTGPFNYIICSFILYILSIAMIFSHAVGLPLYFGHCFFKVQKSFNLVHSCVLIIALVSWIIGVLFRNSFIRPQSSSVCHIFSCRNCTVVVLTIRSFIHFELILYWVRVGVWFYSSTFIEEAVFFNLCFCFLCQKSDGYSCLGLFLSLLFYFLVLPLFLFRYLMFFHLF
jgi:hypothetical protein